ncbi:hypothetical protein BIY27_11415 [Gibbsiella quercinecans]|uniref:hypothetical protein n=1 Tax=Gibbsiella quercinecans TaxID=929813 RepID=UPI000EF1983E|nr:hypothetical protein [Gibbsiella quercinecans]RLM12565.1 hypothetical protein BIY27_11415 [Gibbsiella quercinecans]
MAKITETSMWEDEIHLIERMEKVLGGRGGVANIQARQLAARTQHLLLRINAMTDAKELTFTQTESDPDGTIAGLAATADGDVFRVAQGMEAKTLFIFWLNNKGVAEKIGAMDSDLGVGRRISQKIDGKTFYDDDQPLLTLTGKHGMASHVIRESGFHHDAISLTQELIKNKFIDIRKDSIKAGDIEMGMASGNSLLLVGKHGFAKKVSLSKEIAIENIESEATEHFIFGGNKNSLDGLLGNHTITPQGINHAFSSNFVSVPAWGAALLSDIPDSLEYTRCAVIRYDALKGVTIFNNSDYSLSVGGGRYVITNEGKTGDALKALIVEKGMDVQGWYIPNAAPGDWIFIAFSGRLTDSGAPCFRRIFIGGQTPFEIREPDNKTRAMAENNLAIGNAYSNSANYKANPLHIAEAIFFDRALSVDEISLLYARRKQAMALRGIKVY